MVGPSILLKKCREIGLKIFDKTSKYTHKWKLMDLRANLDQLTRNGSNQHPLVTVSASAPSFSISIVMKGLAQPQQLNQPRPSLLANFEDIDSEIFFYLDFHLQPFTNHRTSAEGGRHFFNFLSTTSTRFTDT